MRVFMMPIRLVPACAVALALWAVFGLSGCAGLIGGPNPPLRFYVLTAAVADGEEAAATRPPTIGVERVVVAEYLDRISVVTRGPGNRVDVAEFDQWAEPLGQAVTNVLAENLTALVPTERIVLLPTGRAIVLDYRVAAGVVRFEAGPDGDVVLIARWAVFDGEQREELGFGRIETRKPVGEPSETAAFADDGVDQPDKPYDAIAAAMSAALAEMSQSIAAEIRALERNRSRTRRG